ncbi:MAG: hypothetical protein ACOX7B_03310 [Christensenellales bacterium]
MQPRKPRLEMQAFPDGLCIVSERRNLAAKGKKPDWQPVIKHRLRFKERAISMNRRKTYLQYDMRIDRLIRCRRQRDMSTNYTVSIGEKHYHIQNVDYPVGVMPPVMDLALERMEQDDA